MKRFFVTLLGGMLLVANALAADASSMIEVGVGGAVLGPDRPVEAAFRINFNGFGEDIIVLARLNATAAGGPDGISYLDIQFEPVQFGFYSENIGAYLSIGGVDIQRNIALGNDVLARITLLGLRGILSGEVNENVQIYLRAAVDVLGLGLTKLQGKTKTGLGFGLSGEIGAVIAKKLRIAFGGKLDYFSRVDRERYIGTTCETYAYEGYWDEWGDYHPGGYYDQCTDNYKTVDGDNRYQGKAYAELVVDLTRTLSVFGSASAVVYEAEVIRDEISDVTTTTGYQFLFGVYGRW